MSRSTWRSSWTSFLAVGVLVPGLLSIGGCCLAVAAGEPNGGQAAGGQSTSSSTGTTGSQTGGASSGGQTSGGQTTGSPATITCTPGPSSNWGLTGFSVSCNPNPADVVLSGSEEVINVGCVTTPDDAISVLGFCTEFIPPLEDYCTGIGRWWVNCSDPDSTPVNASLTTSLFDAGAFEAILMTVSLAPSCFPLNYPCSEQGWCCDGLTCQSLDPPDGGEACQTAR